MITLNQKISALTASLIEGDDVESAGHLCDLLEYVRTKLDLYTLDNLHAMVDTYGSNPIPIKDAGKTNS